MLWTSRLATPKPGPPDDFQAARDAEYAGLLECLPELERELAHERARGRTTYAEVEEPEADLERFRSWPAKIAARDYFAAAHGGQARAAVERCAQALAEFEAADLDSEAPDPSPGPRPHHAPPAGRLRLANPDQPRARSTRRTDNRAADPARAGRAPGQCRRHRVGRRDLRRAPD